MNQKLWQQFCQRLEQAGELVSNDPASQDPLTQAEGYRYLTRLLRAGLESTVEGSNPRFPVFYSLSHDTIKIGNDNPDNYYLNCCISGDYDYLIEGEMGEVGFFSIATKSGSYATTGDMRPGAELTSDQIETNDNGSFSVMLSTTAPSDPTQNWLKMSADSDNLIVRQYCNARVERPAQFSIKCLNAGEADNLNPDDLADKLMRSIGFVEGTSGLFHSWINNFKHHTNALPANDQQMCIKVGGNENIHYHNSHWKLAEDQALIIQPSRIPDCEAWNFQLSNYWMESLDYRYHPITFNNNTAMPDENGQITLVVSHQKPNNNIRNWVSTAGHYQGGMLFRWIGAKEFPIINTRVVKLREL